ncbi:hypothetical protein [Acinetobacter modestus]|uniref:Uncharacterized protein n=1 Tax=Acinetobacter modestus TaxID=1776740 RepID=A0ABP2TUD4_9GAMM|nr:hypothetical protein [Acinetobacter modestus]ENU25913.1 hypothetical protein F992_02775 [Acinetobacter modestus]GGA27596.1 hypothetical protein GCM10017554_25870 [Acinetobacter modestus]
MTTEFQVVQGVVEYNDENGNFDLNYVLEGNFEDDSYEMFSGNWREEGHNYQFDILLEFDEKDLPSLATESKSDESMTVDDEINNDQTFVEELVNLNLNDEENGQVLSYLRVNVQPEVMLV